MLFIDVIKNPVCETIIVKVVSHLEKIDFTIFVVKSPLLGSGHFGVHQLSNGKWVIQLKVSGEVRILALKKAGDGQGILWLFLNLRMVKPIF